MTDTAVHNTDTSDLRFPHGMFRSVFASAPALVSDVGPDDDARVADVASYLDNVVRFLEAHHAGEDAVVSPLLLERCPAQGSLVRRMQDDHDTVDRLIQHVEGALAQWSARPGPDTPEGLGTAIHDLSDALDPHFATEEQEVAPLAARYLSPEEWGGLPAHAMGHFTGDKVWLLFGLIFEQMTSEERAQVLAHLPPPAVDMWTSTGRDAFDDFVRRIRRSPV